MSSAHQGLDETLDDPEAVAERYLQYGEPALIEPYIGPDTWSTESSVLDPAHDVNTAADHMADHGLEFGYHNHNHEFQQLDDADETGYDVSRRRSKTTCTRSSTSAGSRPAARTPPSTSAGTKTRSVPST